LTHSEAREGVGSPAAVTPRFEQTRQAIVHAASALINENGVKGMTFGEVAQRVGLNTTSVTYYFRRKEDLIVAAYDATLDLLREMALAAAAQPDPRARVRHWLAGHVELRAMIRRGEHPRTIALSEIRALADEAQKPLLSHYRTTLEVIAGFFDAPARPRSRALSIARAHILLEAVFWLPAWSVQYSLDEFGRLTERLFEVFAEGLATDEAGWPSVPLPQRETWRSEEAEQPGTERAFLRAATVLINQRGMRGASVTRIAAELDLTKGSFYHHHEAKDDLVLACFDHSHDRVAAALNAAETLPETYAVRLASVLAELVDVQLFDATPLLRTTALQAIPAELRLDVVARSDRLARRFAGVLIDGIAQGSIRAIDPLIASQVIMSTLNSAFEMRPWNRRFTEPQAAVETYLWTLAHGLFSEPD
jgi:AcrR family transcriptional regulator